jgi:hypothetical protein
LKWKCEVESVKWKCEVEHVPASADWLDRVESLVLRVRLTDDALLVTDLRGRRCYPLTEIAKMEEAKGSPTAILLVDGRWVKLPSVGNSLGNSIRAWIKNSRAIVLLLCLWTCSGGPV